MRSACSRLVLSDNRGDRERSCALGREEEEDGRQGFFPGLGKSPVLVASAFLPTERGSPIQACLFYTAIVRINYC